MTPREYQDWRAAVYGEMTYDEILEEKRIEDLSISLQTAGLQPAPKMNEILLFGSLRHDLSR